MYVCYAMGAMIDFLLYGTSDIVSFTISTTQETLNIVTVVLSWSGLAITILVVWWKKY